MSKIERLIQNYKRFLAINPWDTKVAGSQKVWFAVYDKTDERRLRVQLDEFELATKAESHDWKALDVTDDFAKWMASLEVEFREYYFNRPEKLATSPGNEFELFVAQRITDELVSATQNMVVAVYGIGSLYGFLKVSDLIERLHTSIKGRLLIFFPGEYDKGVYRLFDARDGWDYHAIPITAEEGAINV